MDINRSAYAAALFYPLDENGQKLFNAKCGIGLILYLLIMSIPFCIVLYVGVKSVGKIKQFPSSNYGKGLQVQLLKALIAQVCSVRGGAHFLAISRISDSDPSSSALRPIRCSISLPNFRNRLQAVGYCIDICLCDIPSCGPVTHIFLCSKLSECCFRNICLFPLSGEVKSPYCSGRSVQRCRISMTNKFD